MPTQRQRRKRRRRLASQDPQSYQQPLQPREEPAQPQARRSRRAQDGRPPAPWGDFPLTEIVVLLGIVLLIAGFFFPPPQGLVMMIVGLVLGSLGGLELAIREHFAAYRSHNLLLAAAIAVPLFGALLLATDLPAGVCVAAGLVAFGGAAYLFASAFRRRSGGALYRLRGG
jgi:hypothetical protein